MKKLVFIAATILFTFLIAAKIWQRYYNTGLPFHYPEKPALRQPFNRAH